MSIERPTLIIHATYFPVATTEDEVAADPERRAAHDQGLSLYNLLTRRDDDRLSWGAGVPVRIATRFDKVDPAEAQSLVVVAVLGPTLLQTAGARTAALATIQAWRTQKVNVIPVATTDGWRAFEKPLGKLLISGDPNGPVLDEIVLQVARVLAAGDHSQTRLFISHAKGDLDATERAAEKIRDYVQSRTTADSPFFDSVSLLAGEDLDQKIDAEAGSGVFIAVRGDSYSSRSWCIRELVKAKQHRLPMLTVEVLTTGERRSATYSGNGPTIVWPRNNPEAASIVVRHAMVECVRSLLFVLEAKRIADEQLNGAVAISRAPELIDLPALRSGRQGMIVVLHPDPELSVHERGVLDDADKQLRLVTPTTAFSGAIGRVHRAPLDGWQVGMSLSDNPGLDGPEGIDDLHVEDATVFVARTLVASGAAIGYGGDFRTSGYTELFAQLVSAYNQTARAPSDLLHSYMSAIIDRPDNFTYAFTAHRLGKFGDARAEALMPPPPDDVTTLSALDRSLYVSDMRRVMAKHIDASIALFGKQLPRTQGRDGYAGVYAGVIEEAWRCLTEDKPLYVAGGFGGAAGVVADLLDSEALPAEVDETTLRAIPEWKALADAFAQDPRVTTLGLPTSYADLVTDIRRRGRPHLASDEASIQWNGLSVEENRTLFRTRDPLTLTALVLKGLIAVAARSARGKLRIELVEGDIASATDLDILVFPTFSNIDPDGAGAALDRITGGSATQAHRSRAPVPVGARTVGADFLYAADLGDVKDATANLAAHVETAAQKTTEMALRYGFSRIGIVTFMGNVADNLGDVVNAMLRGFQGLGTAQLVWFERDAGRAAMLAKLLGDTGNVDLTHIIAPPLPAPLEAVHVLPRTIIRVEQEDDALDITLLVPQANGLAPKLRAPLSAAERDQLVGTAWAAAPAKDDLTVRGERIAKLLFGDDASRVLDAVSDSEIVIIHDQSSSGIPYEMLRWTSQGENVTPATRGGIVRHLVADVSADRGLPPPAHSGKLGVLLVIDPRGDLPNAVTEGDALYTLLTNDPRGNVNVQKLVGDAASVPAIVAALQDPSIDVIHYCGHAFYRGPEPDGSGLNLKDGELTVAQLAQLKRVPRLAVFNACQAGRVRGDIVTRPPQSFAEYFLRAGVDAYLGTFWLVSDEGAATFAAELYQQLGKGVELGTAIVDAREKLQTAGLSDWANYVLYGRSSFRLLRGAGLPAAGAAELPPPSARVEGSTIVATWTFSSKDAPATFGVAVTEVFVAAPGGAPATELPVATSQATTIDRRDSWHGSDATVQWVATVSLAAAATARGFRLRPTHGDPVDVGTPQTAAGGTRGPDDPMQELLRLRTLLDQQPDRGLEILSRLMPSADPEELRSQIDAEIASVAQTRGIWPFNLQPGPVDATALASFVAAHPQIGPLDEKTVGSLYFQTKEDWARYASAKGAAWFMVGGEVDPPLTSEMISALGRNDAALVDISADLTYDVAPAQITEDGISVAMFSDNGNGLHASRSIVNQIVAAGLPYAFHLGDVYYGGTADQFKDYFATPLEPMLDTTELFMIAGNHELFGRGTEYNRMVRDKLARPSKRQRQRAESFRLCGPGFQMIGLDTMFVGWRSGHMRLHDYADDDAIDLLKSWLDERPNDLTILMTTNEAWDIGSSDTTRLYNSLRQTIAGRVDVWFWGNVHYGALYDPWPFADSGLPRRQMITTCIGHGGYPFYTQTTGGKLPTNASCRWLETKPRFWPDERIRKDVGLNGWCRMTLKQVADTWTVVLTYIDWVGRERLRATLVRRDGESIHFASVEESDIATVGAEPTWHAR